MDLIVAEDDNYFSSVKYDISGSKTYADSMKAKTVDNLFTKPKERIFKIGNF